MKKHSILILSCIFLLSILSGCEEQVTIDSPEWAIGTWYCDYGYGAFQKLTIEKSDIYIRNNAAGAYISEFGIKDSSYTNTEFTIVLEKDLFRKKTHVLTLKENGNLSYCGDTYVKR